MRYEFHPEAKLELYEAALRYELEVPELGQRFGDEVERVVHLLLEHPELGASIDETLRHFRSPEISLLGRLRLQISSTSSPLRMEVVSPNTGGRAFKIANKLLEPTCQEHAAQQWRYVCSGSRT